MFNLVFVAGVLSKYKCQAMKVESILKAFPLSGR